MLKATPDVQYVLHARNNRGNNVGLLTTWSIQYIRWSSSLKQEAQLLLW